MTIPAWTATGSCFGSINYDNDHNTVTVLNTITLTDIITASNTSYTPDSGFDPVPMSDPLPWCTEAAVITTTLYAPGSCSTPPWPSPKRRTTIIVYTIKKTTVTVLPTPSSTVNFGLSSIQAIGQQLTSQADETGVQSRQDNTSGNRSKSCTDIPASSFDTTVPARVRSSSCSGSTHYLMGFAVYTTIAETTITSYTSDLPSDPLPWCTEDVVIETMKHSPGSCSSSTLSEQSLITYTEVVTKKISVIYLQISPPTSLSATNKASMPEAISGQPTGSGPGDSVSSGLGPTSSANDSGEESGDRSSSTSGSSSRGGPEEPTGPSGGSQASGSDSRSSASSSEGSSIPTTAVINGQTVSFGPGEIGLAGTTVPAQNQIGGVEQSVVTAESFTLTVNPTKAIISGTTYPIRSKAAPTSIVMSGQTISLGPDGVGLPTTTVPIPNQSGNVPDSVITVESLTFSVNPTEAIISRTTYPIGSEATMPTTTVINGQTLSLGPGGIGLAATTVPVPKETSDVGQSVVTAEGLTFSVNPTEAIISGTTYPIGSGATISATTIVVNGRTVSLGPNGVGLPTTTIPAPNQPGGVQESVVTAEGLTFSVNPTEAIISGATYPIGSGATMSTTIVVNGQTMSIGPGGVGLPTSTIVPPSLGATGTGSGNIQPFTGGSGNTFGTLGRKGGFLSISLMLVLGGLVMLW